MKTLFIGIMGMIILYCIGKVLYPDTQHKPIQQELIKMSDEERKIWKAQIKKVKENLKEEE